MVEQNLIQYIQALNVERANLWHDGDFKNWSGLEWAGAMCGEAGEAANVAKKLRRVELALDGNAKSEHPLDVDELTERLAGECADVFLYLCLLASRYGIDLSWAIHGKFNTKSEEMGFPQFIDLARISGVSAAVEAAEFEAMRDAAGETL